MSAARIGRIRMKAGGAEIRVLSTPPSADGTLWNAALVRNAKGIASYGELVGYFVVGFFADGSYSNALRFDDDRSPIPVTLMPAYVEEIVRREMVTRRDVDDAIDTLVAE